MDNLGLLLSPSKEKFYNWSKHADSKLWIWDSCSGWSDSKARIFNHSFILFSVLSTLTWTSELSQVLHSNFRSEEVVPRVKWSGEGQMVPRQWWHGGVKDSVLINSHRQD